MNPPTDKTVRRYGFIDKPRSLPEFEECKHGRYVLYSDYASLQSEAQKLREALQRLLRAFESDSEVAPQMDILTCWETNSQAIKQARAALGATAETGGER